MNYLRFISKIYYLDHFIDLVHIIFMPISSTMYLFDCMLKNLNYMDISYMRIIFNILATFVLLLISFSYNLFYS
jgi:hypothetical protein